MEIKLNIIIASILITILGFSILYEVYQTIKVKPIKKKETMAKTLRLRKESDLNGNAIEENDLRIIRKQTHFKSKPKMKPFTKKQRI